MWKRFPRGGMGSRTYCVQISDAAVAVGRSPRVSRRFMMGANQMPKTIEIANPLRLDKLTRVMRIKGVDVYVHWTVFLIAGIMLASTIRQPFSTLAGMGAWLGLIFIHECGHLIAAQWRHCRVLSIELYPIHGFCRFE